MMKSRYLKADFENTGPPTSVFRYIVFIACSLFGVWYYFNFSLNKPINQGYEAGLGPTVVSNARARFERMKEEAKSATERFSLGNLDGFHQKPLNSASLERSIENASQKRVPTSPHRLSTNWGKEETPALRDFSRWADEYAKTPVASQSKLRIRGINLAQARRGVMVKLIAQDPAQAIASAIPATILSELPDEILKLVERRISGIGDFQVIGITPSPEAPPNTPLIERFARFDSETYKASVYGRLATVGSLDQIPMRGVVIDDQAALMDSPIRFLEPGEPLDPNKEIVRKNNHPISRILANRNLVANSPPAFAESGNKIYCLCSVGIEGLSNISDLIDNPTSEGVIGRRYESMGQKKLLVMLLDFSDSQSSPIDSNSTFQQRLDSVNDYFRASSSDQFYFSEMTFTPVMRMPQTASYYRGSGFYGRVDDLYDDAVAKAREIGYEANDYHFDVVAFDTVFNTGWAGLGSIGAGKAWLNGKYYVQHVGVFVHELGHNLGLWHANAWNPNPNTAADNPSGSHVEYGNDFDSMGDTYTYSGLGGINADKLHYNASYKNALGWLPDSHMQTINGNYSGRLYAMDQPFVDGRKNVMRIAANRSLGNNSNLDYWIEHRSLFPGIPELANGALIYTDDEGRLNKASKLLDMNPGTESVSDAGLQNGSSFTDANNRWKIEVTGKGGSGANSYLDIKVTDLYLPTITTHPAHSKVTANTSHTLQVVATGGSLSYQWRKNRVDISGATDSTHTISSFGLSNEGLYDVRVTNSTGSVLSETAILGLAINLVSANSSQDNFGGTTRDSTKWGPTDFIEKAGRFSQNDKKTYYTDSSPTIQDWAASAWHPQALPYGEDWAIQVEVNVPFNTMNPDSRVGVGLFILNQDDHRDQAELTLTRSKYAGVLDQGIWGELDVNNIEVSWESASVSTTYATVRFRWNSVQKRLYYEYDANGPAGGYSWSVLTSKQLDSGSSNWNMNSGSSFIAAVIGASGNKSVAVGDNVWLDDFTITGFPPVITTHPVSQTVAKNSNVTFSVAAGGTALSYQWQKNNTNISGANSATLSLNSVVVSDSGNYRCVVSNTAGSATSDNATLTVVNFFKKWEFNAGGGEIDSSPAIDANGTIFFGTGFAAPVGNRYKVFAINGQTGQKIWEYQAGHEVDSSAAIGNDGTVYIGSQDGKLYAFNGQTGTKKWEFETAATTFTGFHSVRSTPAIGSDGTVYFGSHELGLGGLIGKLSALSSQTGVKLWEFETGGQVSSSPAIGSDGTVYVGSWDNKLYAINGKTGVKLWEFETGGQVSSSPAIGSDGTVYVGSYDNKLYAINGKSGVKLWEFETGSAVRSSPAIGPDGTVYIGSHDHKVYAERQNRREDMGIHHR
jgi:outer membrane protein assembly factor BamB